MTEVSKRLATTDKSTDHWQTVTVTVIVTEWV